MTFDLQRKREAADSDAEPVTAAEDAKKEKKKKKKEKKAKLEEEEEAEPGDAETEVSNEASYWSVRVTCSE